MTEAIQQNKVHISWEEVEAEAYKAAGIIEELLYPKYRHVILAVFPRGGFIPAVLISHIFKNLSSEIITHYNVDAYNKDIKNEIILVDDILDTGATYMADYQILFNCPNSVTLFHKTHSPDLSMLYKGKQFNSNDWLVFPWEKE